MFINVWLWTHIIIIVTQDLAWYGMVSSFIYKLMISTFIIIHSPAKGFGSRPQLGQREVPSTMFPVYSLLHWLQWRHLQPIPSAPATSPKDWRNCPAIAPTYYPHLCHSDNRRFSCPQAHSQSFDIATRWSEELGIITFMQSFSYYNIFITHREITAWPPCNQR